MSEEHTDVVEIDAIAVEEWDREQHTPVQVESNLAELVKKSGLDGGAKDDAAAIDKPRTTTNTMRRTGSAPAMPSKVHKTMAMPTVAAVKPAPPAAVAAPPAPKSAPASATPAQPKAKLEAKTSTAKSATKTTATRVALQPKAAAPTATKPEPAAGMKVAAKLAAAPVDAKPAAPPPAAPPPVAAKPATPATIASTKPAKADATPPPAAPPPAAPPPAATIGKSDGVKSAPVAAKPGTPAAPIAKPAATASASTTTAPLAAPTPAPTVAPSALELPVWPPAAPRAITSEATPRLEAAPRLAPTPSGHSFDDWDEVGGATSVGNRERASSQPPRKPGEDSVIVDLNAVSKTERQSSRRPQSYPILTSEQGTTTSGAFVMPTEAQPQAQRAERPTSPAMPVAVAPQGAVGSAPHGAPASSTAWHTPLPLAAPPPEPAPQWPTVAGLEYNGAHGSAPEIPLPVTRHEPTEPHLARRTLLATVFPTPTSRKKGLLAAAGAVAVILVIVLVSAGGSAKSAPDAPAGKQTHVTTASSANAASMAASTTTSTPKPAAAAPVVAVADPVATPASTPTATDAPKKKAVPAKRRFSRGKKPVVVDYDKKPDSTPEQDEALGRARAAYATGNHHLFAGETDAAIVAYRQALADYPNYVAGYRGLGLAFAQQGNKASALDAFKTYVKLAPAAKDVALIKKRIANLSAH